MNKGFYKNASTMSPFQFDKIYPNKKTMDEECAEDNILIGRYVFIEYNDENENQYKSNSETDLTKYGKAYDSTIWQKIYDKENNEEKYVQIASLDTPLPKVDTTITSPGTNPSVSINYNTSPETYNFNLPKAWGFEVKKAETEYSDEVDEDGNKLNIYYNKNAFNNISFKKIDSFETYASNKYYYISYEEEMQQNNAITQNDVAYIIEQPVETSSDIEPDKTFDDNKYYKVKFLKDNEYLWTNVQESEEPFYTYGATGHFIFSLEDFAQIDENKFKDYSFIKIQNNIYEDCDYANKEAVQADWEAGATIFYLTYEEADKNQYNNNTKYYKLDNNSEYYEISIVEQTQTTPYWEKFSSSSSYYSLIEGEHLRKDENASPQENVQYYKQDDNGSEEFEFEGVIKRYSSVTFGTWEPYKYYKKYEKMGDINGKDFPHENFNGDTYVLSFDEEKQEDTYYEKIPCLKNKEIDNKISLENDTNNEIKELSLILPGLGNTVAEVYDLLYKDGENRNSILYSDIEENQNMYDKDGNPLYNSNEKSVVGLMNKIYDIIGRMKIKDLPDELNDDTIENSDLINTLFKDDDDKYYLVIKYLITENNEEKWVYKAELFNGKSLYHLIAEMQHLVSGSYEGIFNALDNEIKISSNDDAWIDIEKNNNDNSRYSYTINHIQKTNIEPDSPFQTFYIPNINIIENAGGVGIQFYEGYEIDKAGHARVELTTGGKTLYIPSAYVGKSEPEDTYFPVGSIWYDKDVNS